VKRPERTYTPPTTPEDIAFLDALNAAYGTPQVPEDAAKTLLTRIRERGHALDGSLLADVMFLSGMTKEELDEIGGV